jgi:hypothetical protein
MAWIRGGCSLLLAAGAVLLAQPKAQERWLGTWTLDPQRSTFGTSLVPGAPAGLSIVSQILTIKQTEREIQLAGETVLSNSDRTFHDDTRLSLDGKETIAGPISLSFKQIDDANFEIVSRSRTSTLTELSRFAFSADGKTLVETKTQTDTAGPGADKGANPSIRISVTVLVFNRTQ